ncbi:MAG: hypothetical protein LBE36_06735 [Flavobacteriaceae bacterium]|jgi:hypothetical protein|nr:hypothetical protein [Flavobacteriaceae bacterium]
MKALQKIAEKYSAIDYNENNYHIGGGLDGAKFASKRHENAKYDEGKLTLGKAAQMFKNATGQDLDFVKEIINYAVPNMEWHHAGKLPKSYGGGMKKTYFLNSVEIVEIAQNWQSYVDKLAISKENKRRADDERKSREQVKQEFLKENATKIVRVSSRPALFYETNKEMSGKFGWFSSYGKSYNLPEYYTGWQFESEEKYNEFNKL